MKKITISLLLASIFSANAFAATPIGLWRAKQYDAVTKNYINEGDWCFLADGTFRMVSAGGWPTESATEYRGVWKRGGDAVLMHGERVSDSELYWRQMSIVTRTTMVGNGATWSFGSLASSRYVTIVLSYKGACSL